MVLQAGEARLLRLSKLSCGDPVAGVLLAAIIIGQIQLVCSSHIASAEKGAASKRNHTAGRAACCPEEEGVVRSKPRSHVI